MRRYRVGNDMTVLWSISDRNGVSLPLDNKEVHLYYTCERGQFEADIEIQDGNVVAWNFLGKDQKFLGSYTLTLEIIQSGKRTIKKDMCAAFILVGRECEEDYDTEDGYISEGGELTLATELDIYRIQPVIPYIVEDRNGVGYWYVDGVNTFKRASGKSAYEIAVEFGGYEGTEEDFGRSMSEIASAKIDKFGYSRIVNGKEQYFADKASADLYDQDTVTNKSLLLNEVQLPVSSGGGSVSGGADKFGYSRIVNGKEQYFADKASADLYDQDTVTNKSLLLNEVQLPVSSGGDGECACIVDSALSPDSTNPVQSNVLYEKFATKVDKLPGKQLSTEDYTTADKSKLASLKNYDDTNIKASIATTNQNITEVSDRVDDAEADIDSLSGRMDAVELSIDTTSRRVGDLEEEVISIKDRTGAIEDANATIDASISGLDNKIEGLNGTIAEINQKLDGVVESYFEGYSPSRENLPASEWVENGTEADHVGDTFTNTLVEGDGAGKSWRWLLQSDGTYNWQLIADSDAAKALVLAGQAQAAVDGKTTTFLIKPTNYKKGDIWILGDDIPSGISFKKGDILTTDTSSSNFVASHWKKVISYIDTTAFNTELSLIDKEIEDAVASANNYTDEGKAALLIAIEELNNAKANLKDIYLKAEVDGFISSIEMEALTLSQNYSKTARELSDLTQQVYEDGVVTDEELAALKDKQTELEDAKEALRQAIEELEAELAALDELVRQTQTTANQAVDDAHEAYLKAQGAEEIATTATTQLASWLADGVISPTEKTALANELENIIADYNDISNDCDKYGIPADDDTYLRKAFNKAFSDYKMNLEEIVNDLRDRQVITNLRASALKNFQTDYYMYRTAILSTISNFAKELADKAKLEAEEAKTAANAAKKVTDNLNNDLVFTLTEKRSIRSKLKEINPSEARAIDISPFTVTNIESKGKGSWSKVADKADANYGWYVSDMHEADSYAIAKVNFVVAEAGSSMTVHIMSRAEQSYDYTMLGDIDTELGEPTDEEEGVVAETRDEQGRDISYTFTNLTAGSHFFCVYYYKDVDGDESLDNGYFKIDEVFYDGSLGDHLAISKERGVSGSEATAEAQKLFLYLYDKDVWIDEDTAITAQDNFRDTVYELFRNYYSAITKLQIEAVQTDYNYLTTVFGRGNVEQFDGAVLSKMFAVANKEEEVEAIFNGSDFADDTSHGKLILAGGIPEVSSSGSTNLDDRAKEALTRLYEDGHIESESGKIGGFEVTPNGFKMAAGSFINIGTSLAPNWIQITSDIEFNKDGLRIGISNDFIQVGPDGINVGNGTDTILKISAPYLDGYTGERAVNIYSACGLFAGLRPKTRVITTAKTAASPNVLDDLDHSVFVNLTSDTCYIALPQNPQDGQEYYIESRGATMSIKMYQQGYSLYSGNTAAAGYSVTQTGRALLRFKYYAEASLWVYSWLNRNS